jgi:four helix bundle suffix protein
MVQAARSGVQNIAEGSEASATSKKMELKLTQVARASLEELKLDYEDYLRQHGLSCWDRAHPLRQALVDVKCHSADDVAQWVVKTARELCRERVGDGSTVSSGSTPSTFYPELSANAGLTLATVAGYLLDRQVQALAASFEKEGGFTERLYRVRTQRRSRT